MCADGAGGRGRVEKVCPIRMSVGLSLWCSEGFCSDGDGGGMTDDGEPVVITCSWCSRQKRGEESDRAVCLYLCCVISARWRQGGRRRERKFLDVCQFALYSKKRTGGKCMRSFAVGIKKREANRR